MKPSNARNVLLRAVAARVVGVGLAALACACSIPSTSDTDDGEAPIAPISARPSDGTSDTGQAAAASDRFSRFIGAVGLVEISDAKGNRVSTCTATAIGRDLALTSSRCALDCARTRVRFSGKAKEGIAPCAAVEVLESTAGKGFAVLRVVAGKAGESLPEAKIALDSKEVAKGSVNVYLVSATEERGRVKVTVSTRCLLRYPDSLAGEATHACALVASATGGLLVDAKSLAARGISDRTEAGAQLVTPVSVILAR